jgi:NADP-dependent 3-hydroxy acid dehydrogenase YdfG
MFRIGTQMVTLLLGVLLGVIATVLLYSSSEGVIGTVLLSRAAPSFDVESANRFLRQLPTVNIHTAAVPVKAANLEPPPKVCVVAGVGPGIGEHVARRFAEGGCRVAMLARDAAKLANVSNTIPGSKAYACDVTDSKTVAATFSAIHQDLGDVDALIYNVGSGRFKGYDEITAETLELNFKENALGLLLTSQQVGPSMAARGHGVIGITGATSSWRGLSYTAGFAPGNFAARALAESLARDLGPKGVHVFHAVIDGGVSSSPSNMSMHPEDIAETYYNLALQPRSAWTFELSMFAWADTKWYSI